MAGIIYELIDVLEEQKECYEGLNTLATYTENAVINKNIEFLQEVVKTEEQFIGRINNLEKKIYKFVETYQNWGCSKIPLRYPVWKLDYYFKANLNFPNLKIILYDIFKNFGVFFSYSLSSVSDSSFVIPH